MKFSNFDLSLTEGEFLQLERGLSFKVYLLAIRNQKISFFLNISTQHPKLVFPGEGGIHDLRMDRVCRPVSRKLPTSNDELWPKNTHFCQLLSNQLMF